jgi:hypothetical protein
MKKTSLILALAGALLFTGCAQGSSATPTPVQSTPTSTPTPVKEKKIADFVQANANSKTADTKTHATNGYFINTDAITYTTSSGAKVSTYYTLGYLPDLNKLSVSGDSTINSSNSYLASLYFQEGSYDAIESSFANIMVSGNSYTYNLSSFSTRSDDCVTHFSYAFDSNFGDAPTDPDSTPEIWLENAMYACNKAIQYFDMVLTWVGCKTFGGEKSYKPQDLVYETL